MNIPLKPSQNGTPPHDLRRVLPQMMEPIHKRILRRLLLEKTKEELIDAMFEMVHFPDLLDFFRDELKNRRPDTPEA